MYTFLIVIALIICLLLILVILVQNPKGGGLSSAFGGSNQVIGMGVQRTGDFLEKATWGLALVLLAISLSTKFFIGAGGSAGQSAIQEQIERSAPQEQQAPALPGTEQQPGAEQLPGTEQLPGEGQQQPEAVPPAQPADTAD